MKFRRFRSTPTFSAGLSAASKIDRDTATIHDVCAMMADVEALGHGCQSDIKTLQALVEMGNAKKGGVRGRFGHPAMSENATGKKIQVADQFHIENGKLLHRSRLLESARKSPVFSKDPVDFILDVAERNPTEFGESVVISAYTVWILKDGRELEIDPWSGSIIDKPKDVRVEDNGRPFDATTDLPVLRPTAFHYVDFVNEGALTHDGMFSADVIEDVFDGHSSEYGVELFDLVDRWRSHFNVPLTAIPEKVDSIMQKYIHSRSSDMRKKAKQAQLGLGADAQVVETEFDEVEVTDDGEGDEEFVQAPVAAAAAAAVPATDALDKAESIVASMQQPADSEETVPVEGTIMGRLDELDKRMTSFEEIFQRFSELKSANDRMAQLLVQNLELTQLLQRNVARIDGDKVVTIPVAKSGNDALEVQSYAHPAPAPAAFAAKPTHTTSRFNNNPSATPEQAAVQAQLKRASRLGEGRTNISNARGG